MPYGGNIHGAVGADLVQADVDAIVQGVTGSPGKTLADVQAPLAGVLGCLLGNQAGALTDIGGQLDRGLFEAGSSLLQLLGERINATLFSTYSGMPWMEEIQNRLESFLLDSSGYQPWLQTIHSTMGWLFEAYLNDGMRGQPWMATLDQGIQNGFSYHLFNPNTYQPWLQTIDNTIASSFYDPNAYQPWFQTIQYTIESCLHDSPNSRPWMETLSTQMNMLLAVLNDVHDSAQHALRTV